MNPREKRLALAIGGIMLLFVAVFGIRAALLKPLQKVDKETSLLREKLAKLNTERRAYFTAEDQVRGFAERTFSDQVDKASARSGEMLTKQILLSGLKESDFSRLPVGPRKLGRSASEIGWSVQGQGSIENVTDLIFLLQHSPYLHRIENVVMTQGEAPGHVRVGFRFLTVVLERAPVVDFKPLASEVNLQGPERHRYDLIASRDLLRPYLKRPPGQGGPDVSRPAVPAGPESFRVVSLSEWMGQPEVHVRDQTTQQTRTYKTGDELMGGTIVLIDYRPLPLPGRDGLLSFSRVILRIGNEFWAVERGQSLAEKRRLAPSELPQELSKL